MKCDKVEIIFNKKIKNSEKKEEKERKTRKTGKLRFSNCKSKL